MQAELVSLTFETKWSYLERESSQSGARHKYANLIQLSWYT
jgi:hypothetical protein